MSTMLAMIAITGIGLFAGLCAIHAAFAPLFREQDRELARYKREEENLQRNLQRKQQT